MARAEVFQFFFLLAACIMSMFGGVAMLMPLNTFGKQIAPFLICSSFTIVVLYVMAYFLADFVRPPPATC